MKKMVKILTVLTLILLVFSLISSTFAITPKDIKGGQNVAGTTEIQTFGGNLVSIFQTVGVVAAVVIMLVLGIKYMLGSAEEKAEYKKSMIPYLVGAILLFAASTITNIVYQFATGLGGK